MENDKTERNDKTYKTNVTITMMKYWEQLDKQSLNYNSILNSLAH